MNRLRFITALFGSAALAKGQTADLTCNGMPCGVGHGGPDWMWRGKATNNQCPVCGKMAKPYERPTFHTSDGYVGIPNSNIVQEVNGRDVPYGQIERVARCTRCNASFWQDAKK